MTKYQISRKILALLDYDADEIVDAIYKLAKEVEDEDEDTIECDGRCLNCDHYDTDDCPDRK